MYSIIHYTRGSVGVLGLVSGSVQWWAAYNGRNVV
jgi:hypothetical protein